MPNYYAHTKKDPLTKENLTEEHWQPLKKHLHNVAKDTEKFAAAFNRQDLGWLVGLLHDLGKYSEEFQQRLKGKHPKTDHATAGAKELAQMKERLSKLGCMLAYAVMGHHSGLPDTLGDGGAATFQGRMERELHAYGAFMQDLPAEDLLRPVDLQTIPQASMTDKSEAAFSFAFLVRMLFSCLVDADWLDTENFMLDGKVERGGFDDIKTLNAKYDGHIAQFANPTAEINQKRNLIREQCLKKALGPQGLYTLTVPTGGGKTLASLGFALKHAQKYCLSRVIYTIPYTSIIEQNANVARVTLGDNNVLEHHSNYAFENKGDEDDYNDKLKLAAQNWDAPLIFTTNVQFFESLFANKPARCRKLHNIAGSVIILDEAQMLPVEFITPCVRALEELVRHYNCTVVLCSATQPALETYMNLKAVELMDDPIDLERFFKRVEVEYTGVKSDDELAEELRAYGQVLAIVNTKRHAKELYGRLKDAGDVFHLSTFMCPAHRKQKLDEIKERLAKQLPVKVISTQLIEAGVDVDFPVVYRSAAGIDSVVQSAGRCNRNGKPQKGVVRVFISGETYGRPRGYLQRTAKIGERVAQRHADVISAAAVRDYFESVYKLESQNNVLDKEGIMSLFELDRRCNEAFEFKTCAQKFSLIDENTQSVIIPFDDHAEKLIAELRRTDFPAKYLRQLQPYTVNLYEKAFKDLAAKGALDYFDDKAVALLDMRRYDDNEGLLIDKESEAMFI